MTQRGRFLAALMIVAILALAATATAGAHGNLVSADPRPGSTLPVAPERVSARFTEEVDPDGSSMHVRGPDDDIVDLGDGQADLNDPDRTSMTVTLQADLTPGTYTVQWLTVSAEDGHTEAGSFTFTLDPDAPAVDTPVVAALTATQTPLPAGNVAGSNNENDSNGALIVGIVAVLVTLIVVAAVARRRLSR